MTGRSRRTAHQLHRQPTFQTVSPSVAALVAALLAGIWAIALVLLTSASAAAQTGENDEPPADRALDPAEVSIEIVGQTTFVAADGTLGLDLSVQPADQLWAAAEDYELSVTVFGLLESESEVDEPPDQPLNRRPSIPLTSIVLADNGTFHIDVPARSGEIFDDIDRVLLPLPGVYPISVELRGPSGPVASATTHLIRLPQVTSDEISTDGSESGTESGTEDSAAAGIGAPLPVAIILNVSTAEGLTVPDVQQLLTDHPTIPVTVVLQEGVVNLLRADPQLTDGFAAALDGRPVLAVPASDLDPSALAEIDQGELFDEAWTSTAENLRSLGLTVAGGTVVSGAPLTEAGTEALRGLGIRTVLDTESGTVGGATIGSNGGALDVIRIDRELSQVLGGGDNGPHRAARVLSKLTLRSTTDDLPVALGGAELGIDPRSSVDAFLRALNQPGAPRPVLLDEAGGGPTIRSAERPEQDLRPVADLLTDVQELIETYDGFYSGGGNSPEFYREQVLGALTRQRNPEDRRLALEGLTTRLSDGMQVVELHEGQPVTLAAREAPIPILLESAAVGPRNVLLRFESDKVVADHDRRIVTIEPGTSSLNVELEARSLGVSPLEVSVWTPDGDTRLATTRFEIRSTAIPGFGLLVSVGAVALLAAWWVVDARKRRNGQSEPSTSSGT